MAKPRAFGRSKSFSSYVDEALSRGSQYTRNSLPEILPYLEDNYNPDDSKRQLKDMKKQLEHVTKKFEDVTKKFEDAMKEIEDQRSDFESKKDMRETLSNFKRFCGHDNRRLMDLAQELFPEKFPEKFLVLLNFAQEQFGVLYKPLNIDKFWDLMRLVHSLFPKIMDLMKPMCEWFPEKFSCGQIRDLMQQRRDRINKDPKKLRDLENLIRTLFQDKDSREKLMDLLILMSNLPPRHLRYEQFGNVIKKAGELFPMGFPPDHFSSTFTETIAILETKRLSVKDKKLLDDIEDKLRCMKDVAMEYDWPLISDKNERRKFGNEFYYLCKGVSRSNIETFHKQISGPVLVSNARKGKYVVEGQDVGSAVVEIYKYLVNCSSDGCCNFDSCPRL